jgi:hypothetical protein
VKELRMNLPRADAVEIAKEKITEYLLNPRHPEGAGKAIFFLDQGFLPEAWQVFADALRHLAARFPVVKQVDSIHGTKYVVDGELETPSGRSPTVRTVWIVDRGEENPRFVTAYPREQGE